jgi:uncharacterized protein YdgA (DUF945 family)
VGVIIALGVIWTGAAWFTGKQLEKHMDQLDPTTEEKTPAGVLKANRLK